MVTFLSPAHIICGDGRRDYSGKLRMSGWKERPDHGIKEPRIKGTITEK